MKVKCKRRKQTEYIIESHEEAIRLREELGLRPATISETLGPNLKDIYWIGKFDLRPYVKTK